MGVGLSINEREEIYATPTKLECNCKIKNSQELWKIYQTSTQPQTTTESYGFPGFYKKTVKRKNIIDVTSLVRDHMTKDEMEKFIKGRSEKIVKNYGNCQNTF